MKIICLIFVGFLISSTLGAQRWCQSNADCPPGQTCQNNICVKRVFLTNNNLKADNDDNIKPCIDKEGRQCQYCFSGTCIHN